jgi:exodeoxyribonuclease V alpha subunit
VSGVQGSLFGGFDDADQPGPASPDVATDAARAAGADATAIDVVEPDVPAPDAADVAAPDPVGTAGRVEGPLDARALLEPWQAAGVLNGADVHLATTLARLAGLGGTDGAGGAGAVGPAGALAPDGELVVLGAALAARAPRLGHVCLDLATVRRSVPAEVEGDADAVAVAAVDALPWPVDVERWRAALAGSALVAAVAADGAVPELPKGRGVPLVLDGTLLYLERYRAYEDAVAAELLRRAGAGGAAAATAAATDAGLVALVGTSPAQRAAAEAGARGLLSVIVGGPGTGKTTTVAALLARLLDADPATRIGLVAPTGKAAARMGESIAELAGRLRAEGGSAGAGLAERLATAEVATVHRALGWRPDGSFRHHARNPLAHDVVIVDETSMVSLPLMAHLLDAVRPDARVVLVGDPGQLASVEAGSVLGDIAGPAVEADLARSGRPSTPPAPAASDAPVAPADPVGARAPEGPLAGCVSVLRESYRFPGGSAVGRFAAAVRSGDVDAALAVLRDADRADEAGVRLTWCPEPADTEAGTEAVRAVASDSAARAVTHAAGGDVEQALAALEEVRVLCAHRRGPFGVARWNWQFEEWLAGDGPHPVGAYPGRPVLVTANDPVNGVFNGDLGMVVVDPAGPRVAFPQDASFRLVAPARLEALETVHALTIHKSQGSEFDAVVVVLPPADSRLATRELLYTAVTRARRAVTLVGSEEALRRAIASRVVRQTGLRDRLWSPPAG